METRYPNVWVNPTPDEMMNMGRASAMSKVVPSFIAFDLDSVLNTGDYLIRYVAKHFGLDPDTDIRGKHVDGYEEFHYRIPGVSPDEMYDVVNRGVQVESPSCLPSPFMDDVLTWLYNLTGLPIPVVTARHPMNTDVTFQWLYENVSVPFNCFITNGVTKDTVLNFLYTEIFVDDRHKTIRNLMHRIAQPVLYQKPWNQGRPPLRGVVEIRDLRDLIPMINIRCGRVPMDWPANIPFPKPDGERIQKKYASIC